MVRILLCIDDYSELVYIETLLKKLGFDVSGVQNDLAVGEALLAFSPQIVVISSSGTRVNVGKVAQKIKSGPTPAAVVALANPFKKTRLSPGDTKYFDAMLESPISPKTFIECISKLIKTDPANLLNKLDRLDFIVPEHGQPLHIKGMKHQSSVVVRDSKYSELTKNLKLPEFHKPSKELMESEAKYFCERDKKLNIQDLEEKRLAFLKALFKTK